MEFTDLWLWAVLVLLHISVHLSKVYKCSCLHNVSVSVGADNMGTYTHSSQIQFSLVSWYVMICVWTPRNIGTPVLLCLTDNAFLKTNCTFMATLCQASILAQFFLQHLLTSCLCHICIYSILICDQCILMLKAQVMVSILLAIKYWKIRFYIILIYNAFAHLVDYNIV